MKFSFLFSPIPKTKRITKEGNKKWVPILPGTAEVYIMPIPIGGNSSLMVELVTVYWASLSRLFPTVVDWA